MTDTSARYDTEHSKHGSIITHTYTHAHTYIYIHTHTHTHTWSSKATFKQGSMMKTWLAWVRLIPTAPALIDRRNTDVGGSF